MGPDEEPTPIVSVEFEVYGHVQGKYLSKSLGTYSRLIHKLVTVGPIVDGLTLRVYFTKYCRDRCLDLGIGGWVKNSKRGTIVGKLQGTKPKVEAMVSWLSRTGSPGCKIERCELRDFEYLARQDFKGFSIRF